MSTEKTLDVKNIVERAKQVIGIKTDAELANLMNISSSAVSMWKIRGNIDLPSIITLCEKVNMDWLIFGRGEMYSDMKPDTVKGKILTMLDDMDEEQQREILKSIEKEKLIEELLEERRRAS